MDNDCELLTQAPAWCPLMVTLPWEWEAWIVPEDPRRLQLRAWDQWTGRADCSDQISMGKKVVPEGTPIDPRRCRFGDGDGGMTKCFPAICTTIGRLAAIVFVNGIVCCVVQVRGARCPDWKDGPVRMMVTACAVRRATTRNSLGRMVIVPWVFAEIVDWV